MSDCLFVCFVLIKIMPPRGWSHTVTVFEACTSIFGECMLMLWKEFISVAKDSPHVTVQCVTF